MAKNVCSVNNGSVPTAERARLAVGEMLQAPIQSALNMKTDTVAKLRESATKALKFTWVLADNLKTNYGIDIGEKINRALEKQRAHRERLRRYAEDVIHPFVELHTKNKAAAVAVDELGNLSTTQPVRSDGGEVQK
jgi:hypothetical protein